MNNENEIFTNSDIDSSIKMVTAGIMLNGNSKHLYNRTKSKSGFCYGI